MLFLLFLLLILLAGTAFFSGAETALFTLSRYELNQLRRSPKASHRAVAHLLDHPRRLLLTLMIGNVTINMFIFATSLVISERIAGRHHLLAPILGLIAPVVLTLAGDILPKGIATLIGRELAIRTAPFISAVQLVLAPVRVVLDGIVTPLTRLLSTTSHPPQNVTVEEFRELIEMSERHRVIDADENAMLSEVIQLARLKVRNVMVPRIDMVAFEVHDDPDQLRRVLLERHFAKLPVYEGTIDHVIGLVYAKDVFLEPHRPIRQLLRPVHYVPEIINLTQLLAHFRHTRSQLAIAVDEFGGVVGVVTVADVAAEIVGELAPLPENERLWQKLDERHYRLSGDVNIRDWVEQFKVRPRDEWATTLGGLIVTLLGRPAEQGDHVRIGNLLLTVESLRGRRIQSVLLELTNGAAQPAGEERR